MKLGGSIPHIVLVASKGLLCPCGAKACVFALCLKCRHIVASCGGHQKTIGQTRQEHCK